jgi:hypothetical protein
LEAKKGWESAKTALDFEMARLAQRPLAFRVTGNISLSAHPDREGTAMAKWLLITLLAAGLAGCVAEQRSPLPLALAPNDTAQAWATCIRVADSPAYECDTTNAPALPTTSK